MAKIEILECGHAESPHSDITRGYGCDAQGNRNCYECCQKHDLEQIEETGEVFAYLKNDNGFRTVTGWPGYLISDQVKILSTSRDNFGGERTYLRFRVGNHIYSGFGLGDGMYLRAKRTKLTSLEA